MGKREETFASDLAWLYRLWEAGEDVSSNGLLGRRDPRSADKAVRLRKVPAEEQQERRKLHFRLRQSAKYLLQAASWSAVITEFQRRYPSVQDTSAFFAHAPFALTREEALAAVRAWHAQGKDLSTQGIEAEGLYGNRHLIYKRIQKAEWDYGRLVEEATGLDYKAVVRQSLTGSGRRGRLFAPRTHSADRNGSHWRLRSFAEVCVDDVLCHVLGHDAYVASHAHDVRYNSLCGLKETAMRRLVPGESPYSVGTRGPGVSADLVVWRGTEPYVVEVSPNASDPKYPERRVRTEWKARLAAVLRLHHVVVTATDADGVRAALAPVVAWFQ